MASLAPQMMVTPGCLRSLCAVVDGLLNSLMSSDDLELCSFAAPLCSEPHCVLDAPLYLSLKARQGHSRPPDCTRPVAALRALLGKPLAHDGGLCKSSRSVVVSTAAHIYHTLLGRLFERCAARGEGKLQVQARSSRGAASARRDRAISVYDQRDNSTKDNTLSENIYTSTGCSLKLDT